MKKNIVVIIIMTLYYVPFVFLAFEFSNPVTITFGILLILFSLAHLFFVLFCRCRSIVLHLFSLLWLAFSVLASNFIAICVDQSIFIDPTQRDFLMSAINSVQIFRRFLFEQDVTAHKVWQKQSSNLTKTAIKLLFYHVFSWFFVYFF